MEGSVSAIFFLETKLGKGFTEKQGIKLHFFANNSNYAADWKKFKMDDVIRSWLLRSMQTKKLVFSVCQQVLQFYLLPIRNWSFRQNLSILLFQCLGVFYRINAEVPIFRYCPWKVAQSDAVVVHFLPCNTEVLTSGVRQALIVRDDPVPHPTAIRVQKYFWVGSDLFSHWCVKPCFCVKISFAAQFLVLCLNYWVGGTKPCMCVRVCVT